MIADITLIHNTHFIAPRLPKLIKSWEYCSDIHFFLQTKKYDFSKQDFSFSCTKLEPHQFLL